MFEAVEDLDFPQSTLAVSLVFKRAYLFDCHFLLSFAVQCRTAVRPQKIIYTLHYYDNLYIYTYNFSYTPFRRSRLVRCWPPLY